MPTYVDRDATVQLLREEFETVEELCGGLAPSAWDTPTCLPGWTVRDNLSHMIGTESMLLNLAAPESEEGPSDHVKNPIGQANETWVASMRSLPGEEMVARFHEVTTHRLAALDLMSQIEFDAPSWTPAGPDETYGRFMRIRHYDCYMHEHDIRAALGVTDRPAPTHLTSSLDEVATGLGYIVGKRAGLPRGSRLRLALTGPVSREFYVAVEERAAVVASLDGDPTVVLEMPAMLFLRLTGGRQPALPHFDREILIAGDRELATRLASNLAFTI
ncbi:MAG TPA: maleylpyruvate isomerase family mycothiol-dependent enzyme [Acidimicrobiales bacterium]